MKNIWPARLPNDLANDYDQPFTVLPNAAFIVLLKAHFIQSS
jgi:hypothetical protein